MGKLTILLVALVIVVALGECAKLNGSGEKAGDKRHSKNAKPPAKTAPAKAAPKGKPPPKQKGKANPALTKSPSQAGHASSPGRGGHAVRKPPAGKPGAKKTGGLDSTKCTKEGVTTVDSGKNCECVKGTTGLSPKARPALTWACSSPDEAEGPVTPLKPGVK